MYTPVWWLLKLCRFVDCEVSVSQCLGIVLCVLCRFTADAASHGTLCPLHTTDVLSNTCVAQGKVKVKCPLVQALRLCTGRTDHRSRGIALL